MMKRITMPIVTMLLVLGAYGVTFLAPAQLKAQSSKDSVCVGAGVVQPGSTGCTTPTGTNDADKIIKTGLNVFSAIAGIIAVVMMMIAGLKYMTSGGDAGKVASAQNTVLYAAIGIVIVVLAQVIVKFVVGRFTT